MTLEEVKKKHILQTLHELGGHKRNACKSLGITIATLYRYLNMWGEVENQSKKAYVAKREAVKPINKIWHPPVMPSPQPVDNPDTPNLPGGINVPRPK